MLPDIIEISKKNKQCHSYYFEGFWKLQVFLIKKNVIYVNVICLLWLILINILKFISLNF